MRSAPAHCEFDYCQILALERMAPLLAGTGRPIRTVISEDIFVGFPKTYFGCHAQNRWSGPSAASYPPVDTDVTSRAAFDREAPHYACLVARTFANAAGWKNVGSAGLPSCSVCGG